MRRRSPVSDYFQIYSAGVPKESTVFQVTAVNTTTGVITFTPAAAAHPSTGDVAQSGTLTPAMIGQVTSYVPVRLLGTWNSRTSSVWNGYSERFPQDWDSVWWQETNTVLTDIWSLINGQLRTIGQAEILNDGPFAYWPCDDIAGSTAASNLAPANSDQLIVRQSKFGPGSGTYTFGTQSGTILGNADTWLQTGLAAGDTTKGYCLFYQPAASQPLPLTVTAWFNVASGPTVGAVLWSLRYQGGTVAQLYVDHATGHIYIAVWDKVTGARTDTLVNGTNTWQTGIWFTVTVTLTTTTWAAVVDGGAFTGASGTCNLPGRLGVDLVLRAGRHLRHRLHVERQQLTGGDRALRPVRLRHPPAADPHPVPGHLERDGDRARQQ